MRNYTDENRQILSKVVCNRCGKELTVESGIVKEGYFQGDNLFGYFSNKDGVKHSFDLCEECYDKMIKSFVIPVEEEEVNELL